MIGSIGGEGVMDVTLNTIRHIIPEDTVFRVWERLDDERNKETVYHRLSKLPKKCFNYYVDWIDSASSGFNIIVDLYSPDANVGIDVECDDKK